MFATVVVFQIIEVVYIQSRDSLGTVSQVTDVYPRNASLLYALELPAMLSLVFIIFMHFANNACMHDKKIPKCRELACMHIYACDIYNPKTELIESWNQKSRTPFNKPEPPCQRRPWETQRSIDWN